MTKPVSQNHNTTKIRVTAVSYLNTKPFLYGLMQHPIHNSLDISLDIPSVCAENLKSGKADLGLVPVAVIPELDSAEIISDYCIGAVGAVKTVCVYSQVPIHQVEKILLDFHSKTSVALLKILLKRFWRLSPQLEQGKEGYISKIEGSTAGLVIGDRTIGLEEKYAYCYDLSETWTQMSGLPFVFAAWVSTKPLPKTFLHDFNAALALGLEHIPELMYILPTEYFAFDLKAYFTHYISYDLDKSKRAGLALFLSEIAALKAAETPPAALNVF
jgi:chorismate dehydratase